MLEKLSSEAEFVFLKCFLTWRAYLIHRLDGYSFSHEKLAEQFFWFQKMPNLSKKKMERRTKRKKLNMNIIFIDSVSRTEFYYVMPETVKSLQSMELSGRQKVLDFKLFQSIGTNTYNHIHKLFNGQNTSCEMLRQEFIQEMGVNFFSKLKETGYMTLYSRDTCYAHQYLTSPNTYEYVNSYVYINIR